MSLPDGEGAFGPFDGRIWLNTAHQGPLPRVAVAALERCVREKQSPQRLVDERFLELPRRLRSRLARLVGGQPDEVVLGNSASWGLQAIANAFPWRAGDEIALLASDYPATQFPWLLLERRGVQIRWLEFPDATPDPVGLVSGLGPRTRIVCLTWVDSYTGRRLDIASLGAACRGRGVHVVVNATQAVGAIPVDVKALDVDALSASGFKWLCGPYATGFAWISPRLLEVLQPIQSYWLAQQDDAVIDLSSRVEARLRDDLGARGLDVFGTANFFNFDPWLASLDMLLQMGPVAVAEHDSNLVSRLLQGLRRLGAIVVTPVDPDVRAGIVAFDVPGIAAEDVVRNLADAGIDVCVRLGHVRVSPHVHNTLGDIDTLVSALGRRWS
jgi:cysteine desulfurase/selenocysteine lyase